MSAKAYLKENNIYLFYDKNDIGRRSGCIYDLGYHLLNFIWFDLDTVSDVYSNIMKFNLNPKYLESSKHEKYEDILYSNIDMLDSFCPYLHFYTQAFLNFMFDYPKKKEDAIYNLVQKIESASPLFKNILIKTIPDKDQDIGNEINKLLTMKNPPRQFTISNGNELDDMLTACELARQAIIIDMKSKRKALKEEINFISNVIEKSDAQKMTPMQRLYLFDSLRQVKGKKLFYTDCKFTTEFTPLKRVPGNIQTTSEMAEYITGNNIDVVEMYDIDCIDTLIRFELLKTIDANLLIKKCKYCGHYFIPKGRIDAEYCDRVAKGETKPCNIIGSMKHYQSRIADNPIHEAYNKAYKRNNSRVRNKHMKQSEFLSWSEAARTKRNECYTGKLSLEEFTKWLDEEKKE